MKSKKSDIILLQETHFTQNVASRADIEWGYGIHHAFGSNLSCGVSTIISPNANFKLLNKIEDPEGRFLILHGSMEELNTVIINCYAPNQDNPTLGIDLKNILQVNFDPFSIKHSQGWKNVMEWFNREVASIEGEAKHFIDESFKTLRSAEGAFDMLQNFKHIRSREAINTQMMKKFNDILLQYGKEVFSIFNVEFNVVELNARKCCTIHLFVPAILRYKHPKLLIFTG